MQFFSRKCVTSQKIKPLQYEKNPSSGGDLLPGMPRREGAERRAPRRGLPQPHRKRNQFRVYLPDGYDTDKERTYPVLYLLHGSGGTCDTWPKKYNMKAITDWRMRSGFSLPMIIVMPDARGMAENFRGKNLGYFNLPGWHYQDFFFEEFIPEIEKRYRIRGERAFRAIAGLSMGGGGTTIYAMEHPELFSTACPLSARVEGVPDSFDLSMADYVQGIKDHNMVEYLKNASPEVQKAIGQIRWYIDVGDNDYLFE